MTTKFFEKLSSNLSDLINNDEYNVVIEVGQAPNNQVFKAHSVILNSRCLYFKDKLNAAAYENGIKIIKNIDISVDVFEIIIKYIYDGTISLEKVDTSVVFDLLIASNEFGLEELVKHVQSLLIENASWLRLNFARVYQACFNLDALQNFCANIIAKYPNIIFDSEEFVNISENFLIFILKLDNLQIDEGLIWDYIIRWGIAQNPSLTPNPEQWSDENFLTMKNTLKNCLPLIRYFQISGKDIFKKVRPYQKILDPNLWTDIEMKFMIPDQAITSQILPPRNSLLISLPSRFDQALTISKYEIELNNVFELKKRGKFYFKMKRYNEALADLNKAFEIESKIRFASISSISSIRGEIYFMMGKYQEALADLNQSIESFDITLIDRGIVNFFLGRYKEALLDFNRYLETKSDDETALMYRGEIYRKIGKYEEALTDLTMGLKINSRNFLLFGIRGLTYSLMGRYDDAHTDLNEFKYKLLTVKPNDECELNHRGLAYFLMGRYNEALADFAKLIENDRKNSTFLVYRGEIYRIMGKYEEALADITKCLNENWLENFVAMGIQGLIYRSMGRYDEAHTTLNELNKLLLEFELRYSRTLLSRGKTYLAMNKYEEALADLTKSLESMPNNVLTLVYRGETYRMMNRYKEALADLTKSLEICPNNVGALEAHKKLVADMRKIEK